MTEQDYKFYLNEGLDKTNQGKFEEAYAVMQQIKSENFKEDYVYWEHMGAIQAGLGKTADAVKSYKLVLKLRPNNKAAKEFLKNHR